MTPPLFRRVRPAAGAAAGFLLLLLPAGCGRSDAPADVTEGLRRRSLDAMCRLSERRPLIPVEQGLVVVRDDLVEHLLDSVLPFEPEVTGGYRVRLEDAVVTFEDGLGLITMTGRAGRGDGAPFLSARITTAVEEVTFDAEARHLRARLRVLGVTTERIPGRSPRGLDALYARFARLTAGHFEGAGLTFDIPVDLDDTVTLPEIGPRGGVHIRPAAIPLAVTVTAVTALFQRLWVSVRLLDPADSAAALPPSGRLPSLEGLDGKDPAAAGTVEARRDTLADRALRDPLIAGVLADGSGAAVGVTARFLEDWFRRSAAVYLDKVDLDLSPDIEEDEDGTLRVRTPIGRVAIGDWRVLVEVDRLAGRLSAGTPSLDVSGGRPIRFELPVDVRSGEGAVTLDVEWKPNALVSLICRPFRDTVRVDGAVLPQAHTLRGEIAVIASGDSLLIDPRIERDRFPIEMTLSKDSWALVRARLDEEDRLSRCGLIVDADEAIAKLRALGLRGIRIRMPEALLPPLTLPARVSRSVTILDRAVRLEAGAQSLRSGDGFLWTGAPVMVRPEEKDGNP